MNTMGFYFLDPLWRFKRERNCIRKYSKHPLFSTAAMHVLIRKQEERALHLNKTRNTLRATFYAK